MVEEGRLDGRQAAGADAAEKKGRRVNAERFSVEGGVTQSGPGILDGAVGGYTEFGGLWATEETKQQRIARIAVPSQAVAHGGGHKSAAGQPFAQGSEFLSVSTQEGASVDQEQERPFVEGINRRVGHVDIHPQCINRGGRPSWGLAINDVRDADDF